MRDKTDPGAFYQKQTGKRNQKKITVSADRYRPLSRSFGTESVRGG